MNIPKRLPTTTTKNTTDKFKMVKMLVKMDDDLTPADKMAFEVQNLPKIPFKLNNDCFH